MVKQKSGAGYGSIPNDLEVDEDEEDNQVDDFDDKCPPFRRRLAWIAAATLPVVFIFLITMPRRRYNSRDVNQDGGSEGGEEERGGMFHRIPSSSSSYSSIPRYYLDQLVDHTDPDAGEKFSQKYYEQMRYFAGPGYPIFLILGGEDPLEGILYPFVSEVLGKRFSAYTMTVEHRFFGESWPIPLENVTNDDLRNLLTPEQAMSDFVRIIQRKQRQFGCGPRGFSNYCPVMTVGSSYPGFLSVLMRLHHPETVDIAYAGSAPLYLYSHSVNSNAYYDKVTQVADDASPGCAKAVRKTLREVQLHIQYNEDSLSVQDLAIQLGICNGTVPQYIDSDELFSEELMMVIVTHFADYNMGYYPPGSDTDLWRACQLFQDNTLRIRDRISGFLRMTDGMDECFDMMTEVPPGPYGHISASDWSGVAGEAAGWMWDFLSCLLQPETGMSSESMFPPRQWTKEWLDAHCKRRFGLVPDLDALNDKYHFSDLTNVSRLLLTNGMNDGWSVASVLVDPARPSMKVLNFPNGAHHSDLTHEGPSDADTSDIKEGHEVIGNLISSWLTDSRST